MKLKIYSGKKGIKKLVGEFSSIQKSGDVVCSFGYEGGFDRALGKEWWKTLKKGKGAKTKFKGVFSWHKLASKPHTKRTEVRYIKAGKGNIEVAIWKDTVRIFLLTRKNPSAILIKDSKIAHDFMNYWKFLWQNGKEAKRKI